MKALYFAYEKSWNHIYDNHAQFTLFLLGYIPASLRNHGCIITTIETCTKYLEKPLIIPQQAFLLPEDNRRKICLPLEEKVNEVLYIWTESLIIAGTGTKIIVLNVIVNKITLNIESKATEIAFNPVTKEIISGSPEGEIQRWDIGEGTLLGNPMMGHTSAVKSLAISGDGQMIVSRAKDKTIRRWYARIRKIIGDWSRRGSEFC